MIRLAIKFALPCVTLQQYFSIIVRHFILQLFPSKVGKEIMLITLIFLHNCSKLAHKQNRMT